jgi:hypothetical protein
MREQFILDLKRHFSGHSFTEMRASSTHLYVQEINKFDDLANFIRCTVLMETLPTERHFKVSNKNQAEVAHICIDGDFITYGQSKYDEKSPKIKDGRPESLIFDNNSLLFLELKVEQEDATFEKEEDVRWKAFFKGLTQIEDFVKFLRNNSFEVSDYFQTVKAVICLRFEPKLISNAKRNTELVKRSTALGFLISPPHNHQHYFELH